MNLKQKRFNTQPPEGGWKKSPPNQQPLPKFQHTAARRRLAECAVLVFAFSCVSTHSRPKAAGTLPSFPVRRWRVSTHSRPKAAGFFRIPKFSPLVVSTHSRPKAAGTPEPLRGRQSEVSTHSRPKAAGFMTSYRACKSVTVSTHSRPKAAGTETMNSIPRPRSFNTQPPEGGWRVCVTENFVMFGFNTQPPEGGWVNLSSDTLLIPVFQHTAARRRLAIAFALRRWSSRFQHTAARRRLDDKTTKSTLGKYVSTHSRPKAAGDHTEHHQQ